MKSFKQFTQCHDHDVEQGKIVNGVPCAVILHDRGPRPTPGSHQVKQGVVVNGVPSAVVLQDRGPRPVPGSIKEDTGQHHDWEAKNDNAHLGKDSDVVEDIMHDKHKHAPDSLKHLKNYTMMSQPLNVSLYKSHVKGEEPSDEVRDNYTGARHNVPALDNAVNHHVLDHDLHVYSGTHFHPGVLAANHPEGHIHLPAYTSTSLDKGTAAHFGKAAAYSKPSLHNLDGHTKVDGHVLHLHLKPGDKGAYMGQHSEYPAEKEFVLPRSTRIKVHPTPQIHHQTGTGLKFAVWHAETVKP